MKIQQLFEAWRNYHRMTYKQAAEEIGVPWDTYRRIEKGDRVSIETLLKLLAWMLG